MEERLQKILAQAGFGSRRSNESIIQAGRVTVNGQVASLGAKADPRKDTILIDGEPLPPLEEKIYIAFHKPRGIISDDDDLGRKSARQFIPIEAHLYPVGRLDKESMGLVLLTNDGTLAHRLTHPRFGHEKKYRVKVGGAPTPETLGAWRRGVELDDGLTLPVKLKVTERTPDYTWLEITMREGRKRQIRRVASLLGHPVLHLTRVQIGPIALGDLGLGKWRHLTRQEVSRLQEAVARPNRSGRARAMSRPRRKPNQDRRKRPR